MDRSRRHHRRPTPRSARLLATLALVATLGVQELTAQSRDEAGVEGASADHMRAAQASQPDESRHWWLLWSRASRQNRLLPAMWTLHVHHMDEGLSNDSLLGLIHSGFYAASFQTTHGPRAYTVGFERDWISGSSGPLGGMLGFRAGLVYGYDGRLGWMAEAVPILPFAQPVAYGRLGPLAADLTYTWVVISLTAGLRF